MRAADPGIAASRRVVERAEQRRVEPRGHGSFTRTPGDEMCGRFHACLGRHRIPGAVAGGRMDGGARPPECAPAATEVCCLRGPVAIRPAAGSARHVDERCARRAGAALPEGADRGRVRCRSRRLGSRREPNGQSECPATAPQAHAVCRTHAAGRGPCHLSPRRAGLGWRSADALGRRPPAMSDAFLDLLDLACERFGGAVVAANDEFFGTEENLIKRESPIWIEGKYTERGKWMDGWETRRRRDVTDESHDWCIVRLGAPGRVAGVNVDTACFRGNFPAACALDATDL